jgi:signal transduction histidine kinase
MRRRVPFLGSLRGLRIQLMLWTVLPLTLVLVAVAVGGIITHQHSMQEMVEELDARSARLAAAHLSDELEGRVALLSLVAAAQTFPTGPNHPQQNALEALFDGGLARFTASGELVEALPSAEVWLARPVFELLAMKFPPAATPVEKQPLFSPLFDDPVSGRTSLLIGLVTEDGNLVVGAVSLDRLKLTEIIAQAKTTSEGEGTSGRREGPTASQPIAFLVDTEGRIIYHPDPGQIGRDLRTHEGVIEVTTGHTGATYHREPNGQELVVGYAPVAGPGWGLIVQEPWEALIAPGMRLSLLAPLVVVVAALVSGLAVTFGLRYVMRPLQALDRLATRVAWGDFSAASEPVGGVQEIEDLRRTLEGMAAQIQRYQTSMRDYIATVTTAQEEERKRLARELHDETVQSLIALSHRVEMVQKALDKDPERARQRLVELRTMTDEVQDEVRRFSRALRPLYLEDLGFVPALEMLAQETTRRDDLQVSVDIKGEVRRLSPDLELTAYRIAQEGLSNVVRHANAQNAWLTVIFTPDDLTLHLHDDGQGFTPPLNPADLAQEGHFGLMGIRERALLFGGRLDIRSKPGEGTSLEVFLPQNDMPQP